MHISKKEGTDALEAGMRKDSKISSSEVEVAYSGRICSSFYFNIGF